MALPYDKDAMTLDKMKVSLDRLTHQRIRDHMSDAMFYGGMGKGDTGAYAWNSSVAIATQEPPKPDRLTPNQMQAMICSRMGWTGIGASPFRDIEARKLTDEQAVVFLIVGDRALIIHDDLNLFPSDALVTQLRLLS